MGKALYAGKVFLHLCGSFLFLHFAINSLMLLLANVWVPVFITELSGLVRPSLMLKPLPPVRERHLIPLGFPAFYITSLFYNAHCFRSVDDALEAAGSRGPSLNWLIPGTFHLSSL